MRGAKISAPQYYGKRMIYKIIPSLHQSYEVKLCNSFRVLNLAGT
jgi:hypothetical protein